MRLSATARKEKLQGVKRSAATKKRLLWKKESENNVYARYFSKKMFNFVMCSLCGAHNIIELKGPQTTKPPILFECVALEMYTRIIKHCSQLHSADCLFIRMCTGRLAVPVVVWVACGTHFFININALVL